MKTRASIALLVFVAACSPRSQLPGGADGEQSIVSAINGIDEDLQKAETLQYILKCQPEANKDRELTPADAVATVTVKPADAEKHPAYLKFELTKPVATGDYCALDVKGDGDYGTARYTFDPNYKDLFYASTKAQVDKNRSLEVTIYPTYEDPAAPTKEVIAQLAFPEKEKHDGTYKVVLECDGSKAFQTRTNIVVRDELKLDARLYLKSTSIPAAGLRCSKLVLADATSKEEKFISFVDVNVLRDQEVRFAAPLSLKQNVLKAIVNRADEDCTDFDVQTRRCLKDADLRNIPEPAVDRRTTAISGSQMVMVCRNPDETKRPFYENDVVLFTETSGSDIIYRASYRNATGNDVVTPPMRTTATRGQVKFAFDAPQGRALYWAYVDVAGTGAARTYKLRLEVKPDGRDVVPNFWESKTCTVSQESAMRRLLDTFGVN